MIADLNFANSALGIVCRTDDDGQQQGCESLVNPELNGLLATWKPIYFLSSGCACFPGAAGGGNPGDLCFRPSSSDSEHSMCQTGAAGIDVCDKAWLWCASRQCAVRQGELWGVCL